MTDSSEESQEKIKIYVNIQPLNLKIGALFNKSDTFQSAINFVYNQTKKLDVKFELGKIIENKSEAIILPEFKIGDFLQATDEISVFSNNRLENNVSNLYKSLNFLKKKRNEEIKNKQKTNEEKDNKNEKNSNNDQKNKKNNEQKNKTPKKNENKESEENKEKKNSKENKEKAKNKTDKKSKSAKKNKHDDEDIKLDENESNENNSDDKSDEDEI